jgi:hypothetical protein
MILVVMTDDSLVKKKKAKRDKQTSLLAYKNNPAQSNQVLSSLYVGKRVFLTPASLYGHRIPAGEEEMLFQDHIGAVNSKNKTATIKYNDKCIKDGDHMFQLYPDQQDSTIPTYNVSTFVEDHKRFFKHLGHGQKIINNAKEVREKEEKAAASQTLSDISDLDAKVEQEISFYDIILDEFEPAGEMQDHVVLKGPHAEKVIKKQKWS